MRRGGCSVRYLTPLSRLWLGGWTRKIAQQPSRSAARKWCFPTQRKVFLLIDRTLGLSRGQGDEQGFFCSFDRPEFDAYKLFWLSRVACVRWRPDRDYGHGYAEEQVSFRQFPSGHDIETHVFSACALFSTPCGAYFNPQAPRDWRRWTRLIESHFCPWTS